MNISSCMCCKKRTLKCHSGCEEYRMFQEENKRIREKRREEQMKNSLSFRAKYYK